MMGLRTSSDVNAKVVILLLLSLCFIEAMFRVNELLRSFLAGLDLNWFLRGGLVGLISIGCSILPLSLLEFFFAANRQVKFRFNSVVIWIFVAFLGVFVGFLTARLIGLLELKPLFSDWRKNWGIPSAVLLIVYMIIFDFFYYWFHRAQHTFSLMWRVHSVHHSIRDISALNSYHHLLEDVLRVPMVILPLSLLISIDAESVIFVSAFTAAWGYFLHMNADVHFGPLGSLFGDARYHRVHHSLDAKHWNKNYAAFFPPWDRLFGTQVTPPQRCHLSCRRAREC